MRTTWLILQGLHLNPFVIAAFLLLSILTLMFSMIVASRMYGGIEFGSAWFVLTRSSMLIGCVLVLSFFTCGIVFAGVIWYFGLMLLFHLDPRETRLLTKINWTMGLVWKVLITLAFL